MNQVPDNTERSEALLQSPIASDRAARRSLTDAEATLLVQQVSGLANANLALPSGLRAMAQEIASGPLRAELCDLASRIEQGEPLPSALGSQGSRLPEHLRGLIRVGVESGRLGELLAQYVHHATMAKQLRRSVLSSMIYPAILLLVFAVIFSFMMLFVVPMFRVIFMDFGVELPSLTLVLLAFSDWTVEFVIPALCIMGVIIVCLWLIYHYLMNPLRRRRLLHRVPLLGSLWQFIAYAEFARILALLVEREMPLPRSLRLVASGLSDACVSHVAQELACDIESGQSLADSPTRRAHLPPVLAQSLAWSDSSQALADSLRTAAEMIESQARVRAEFMTRAAPPITMIMIVMSLGFIVTALFLPMFKLITELSA